MSWLGLTHKGTEPLYSDEWNRVVDGLDILYGYISDLETNKLDRAELFYLKYDIIPDKDNIRDLGSDDRSWAQVHAHYGYFKDNVYVQGKAVIKDGDPIRIESFIDGAKLDIDNIYDTLLDIKDSIRRSLSSVGLDNVRVEISVDGVGLAKESTLSEIQRKVDELYGIVSDLNGKIERRIQQFIDGALSVDPRFAKRIEIGYAFSASHRFENVADGDFRDVWFENPANSGREVNIVAVEVALLGQAWIDIYRDNVKVASGTPIRVMNLNMGSMIEATALPEYGGQYTPGATIHSTVAPGGRLVRVLGSVVEAGERVKIPPGYNILIRTTNKAGVATDFSVRIIWWEDPL